MFYAAEISFVDGIKQIFLNTSILGNGNVIPEIAFAGEELVLV